MKTFSIGQSVLQFYTGGEGLNPDTESQQAMITMDEDPHNSALVRMRIPTKDCVVELTFNRNGGLVESYWQAPDLPAWFRGDAEKFRAAQAEREAKREADEAAAAKEAKDAAKGKKPKKDDKE